MGYILLGIWMFLMTCAVFGKIEDLEKKLRGKREEDDEPWEEYNELSGL